MKRIYNQVRKRWRQAWLDLPASGIEEVGYGQDQRGIATGKTRQGEGVARADQRYAAYSNY
ncbi:hypothetical protein H7A76_30715 [Pseudomonas sp. MSSRFD41]|uniref:hypothetical protein n=1 Tax=Pseudomonas sp. MSSRFD41 TaxID=1310370 RepID=UPI00163A788C|nr:hypothetical protein [Pseudomonas sp. MSSRFD41]MBC2659828.1 hypothetical protein [Pseudomonas sp. MSSRFD41]